jgi:hypothetical protein
MHEQAFVPAPEKDETDFLYYSHARRTGWRSGEIIMRAPFIFP